MRAEFWPQQTHTEDLPPALVVPASLPKSPPENGLRGSNVSCGDHANIRLRSSSTLRATAPRVLQVVVLSVERWVWWGTSRVREAIGCMHPDV